MKKANNIKEDRSFWILTYIFCQEDMQNTNTKEDRLREKRQLLIYSNFGFNIPKIVFVEKHQNPKSVLQSKNYYNIVYAFLNHHPYHWFKFQYHSNLKQAWLVV